MQTWRTSCINKILCSAILLDGVAPDLHPNTYRDGHYDPAAA